MKKVEWFNAWDRVQSLSFFLFLFIGGRGIGKTYSMIDGLYNSNEKFFYIRRTENEIDICATELHNPFRKYNADKGTEIHLEKIGKVYFIYDSYDEEKKLIGYAGALSTFGKFRGSEFNDVNYILFDEFINKGGVDTIAKSEFMLFNDMLEQVNRNREIEGYDAIKVILLSNANTINDPLLYEYDLINVIANMKLNNSEVWEDNERGIYISLPKSNISELKKETAVYRLNKGNRYYQMSIENNFNNDTFNAVTKLDYRTLIPFFNYHTLYFYNVKGNQDLLYVTQRKSNVRYKYSKEQLKAFRRDFYMLINYYQSENRMLYENVKLKIDLERILKK